MSEYILYTTVTETKINSIYNNNICYLNWFNYINEKAKM